MSKPRIPLFFTKRPGRYIVILPFIITILWIVQLVSSDIISGPINYAVREIRIIPMGTAAPGETQLVKEIIRQEFPAIKVDVGVALPSAGLSPDNRYNADRLLEQVEELSREKSIRLVGVTDADLFVPGLNYVFARQNPRGNAIVLSLARLLPEKNTGDPVGKERIRKVVLRALGVTFGFRSGTDIACVMAYSDSLEELDRKGDKWCGNESESILKIEGFK